MSIKVCLDAGHYGKYNRSNVLPSYWESEMTWKLTNFLVTALEKYGIEVIKTRSNQAVDLALESRGKKSSGCNLFLSIHSNACDSATVDYPLACCMVDDKQTKIDDISVELGLKLAQAVGKTMGCKQSARILQRAGSGGSDYYGVIRGAKKVGTPAILLEHGFHTNLANAKWLMIDDNLEKMAYEETKVIADYFGVSGNNSNNTSAVTGFKEYRIKVSSPDGELNVRKEPSMSAKVVSVLENSNIQFTIVAEQVADGVTWGKLKSGLGWISVNPNYVTKVS